MSRLIAWICHLVSAVAAINWGLARFLRLNLIEHFASLSTVPLVSEILYMFVTICGISSFFALFTPSRRWRKKQ